MSESAKDVRGSAMRAGYEPTFEFAAPTREMFDQQVDGEWWTPRFGSDSLQHVLDDLLGSQILSGQDFNEVSITVNDEVIAKAAGPSPFLQLLAGLFEELQQQNERNAEATV